MKKNADIEAFAERPLCNAPTKHGGPCQSRAMRNSTRCRSHGGNTPAAIDAARVRALRQADPLMAKLHAIAFDDTKPPQVQLEAIKHALKVTGAFETAKSIEIDVVGTGERTFMDFVGDALVDVEEDDDDPNVWDAEVIEDDDTTPLVPREDFDAPPMSRHDRAVFREVERNRRTVSPGDARSRTERLNAEREALDLIDRPRRSTGRSDDDGAMYSQQEREDEQVRRVREAERRLNDERNGGRRARNTEATMSQPTRRKRR